MAEIEGSMEASCFKCRFYFADDRECRRYAPRPDATQQLAPSFGRIWNWPLVREEDWCGEFELTKAPADKTKRIREGELSETTLYKLKKGGIETWQDLAASSRTYLLTIPNLGLKSMREIEAAMRLRELELPADNGQRFGTVSG